MQGIVRLASGLELDSEHGFRDQGGSRLFHVNLFIGVDLIMALSVAIARPSESICSLNAATASLARHKKSGAWLESMALFKVIARSGMSFFHPPKWLQWVSRRMQHTL